MERCILETEAIAVVIDPLSAYLGRTDSYKDSEVRGLLTPLSALAQRHSLAILVVMHLTKDTQRRAIHRAGGSIGFVGAARIVLAVGKDPNDEARRLLVPVKNNLTAPPPTLAYRIEAKPEGRACVEWEPDPVEGVEADALLGQSAPEDRQESREAADLLRELLALGERPSQELWEIARENGISERTWKRAKHQLGVKARKEGQPGQRGRWYRSLPSSDRLPNKATLIQKKANSDGLAFFGDPSEKTHELTATSPKGATAQGSSLFATAEVDLWPES